MEIWLGIIATIVSVLSLLGFGVVAKLFWEDRHRRKIQNTEEVKQLIKFEKQEEIRHVFREEIQPVSKTVDEIKALSSINARGTLTLLRDRMKMSLNYCKCQGWATSSDKANWLELYNTYKMMGGNHFVEYVDQWKQEMETIPLDDEEHKNKSKTARNKIISE